MACASSQVPTIGEINFYGLFKVTPERILKALKLQPGERLTASRAEMQDRLEEVSGVVLSHVEAVCCDGSRTILFIGVEERGEPHAAFRSDPGGSAVLPPQLIDAYDDFLAAVTHAAAQGRSTEDLTAGHSMMDDPQAWAVQNRFLEIARRNLTLLRDVLHDGSEPGQRAIAAALIGYAPNKSEVINDLQYALTDPDESVRANALRSLTAIAVLASREPALGLHIPPTWMVELLNSVVLGDRVESVKALLALTGGGASGPAPGPESQAALDLIRERALHSVVEMARWTTPSYALPPFLLAGRLAGMSYVDTLQAWANGDHAAVLDRLLTGRKKSGATLQ